MIKTWVMTHAPICMFYSVVVKQIFKIYCKSAAIIIVFPLSLHNPGQQTRNQRHRFKPSIPQPVPKRRCLQPVISPPVHRLWSLRQLQTEATCSCTHGRTHYRRWGAWKQNRVQHWWLCGTSIREQTQSYVLQHSRWRPRRWLIQTGRLFNSTTSF